MSQSISTLTAAQLAQAAYTGTPPAGWTTLSTFSSGPSNGFAAGTSSVTAFQNTQTGQIVISFKGSDNLSNFQSDLGSSGGSAWESLQTGTTLAANGTPMSGGPATLSGWYAGLQADNSTSTFIADGHSLGGGMAQTFALEVGISGFGFNSLPISSTAISTDSFFQGKSVNTAITNWQSVGNTFAETNVSGDPATLYYSSLQGQTYLSTSTSTLPSNYAACEIAGTALLPTPLSPAGAGMVADCAANAHLIGTAIDLLENPKAPTGDSSAMDAYWGAIAPAIEHDFTTATLTNTNGVISASVAGGPQVDVTVASSTANSNVYSVSETGQATQSLGVVTGAGANISLNNASVIDQAGLAATVVGAGDTVNAANGTSITIGGNGTTGAADTLNIVGGTVNVESGSKVNINGANDSVTTSGSATITGNNETISVAAGATVTIVGSGDTINAGAGANVTFGGNGVSGTADTLNETGGTVTVQNGSNVNVNGANDTVTAGTSDNLGVHGSTDTVNASSGDGVWVGNGGATVSGDKVNATGATVTIGQNTAVDVYGTSDTVSAGSGDNFGVHGSQDTVSAVAGDSVWIGNAGAAVTGDIIDPIGASVIFGNNVVAMIGGGYGPVSEASSDKITINSSAETINVTGTSDMTIVNASNDTMIFAVGANKDSVVNYGNNDITKAYGNQDQISNIGLNDSDTETGASDRTYNANTTDTAIGTGTGDFILTSPLGDGYYGYYDVAGGTTKPGPGGSNIGAISEYDNAVASARNPISVKADSWGKHGDTGLSSGSILEAAAQDDQVSYSMTEAEHADAPWAKAPSSSLGENYSDPLDFSIRLRDFDGFNVNLPNGVSQTVSQLIQSMATFDAPTTAATGLQMIHDDIRHVPIFAAQR